MSGFIFGRVDIDDYIFVLTKLIRIGDIALVMEVRASGMSNIENLKYFVEYWAEMQDAYLKNNEKLNLGASRENNPCECPVFQSEKLDISNNGESFAVEVIYPMNYAAIWTVACQCASSELFIIVDRESMKGDAEKFLRQTDVLSAVFSNVHFSNKEMYKKGEYFKAIDEFVLGTEFCMFNDLGSDWGYQPVLFVKNDPLFSELYGSAQLKDKTTLFSWGEMYLWRLYKIKMSQLEEERELPEKNREAEGG